MGVLALGYFLTYIPFAALTRALSTGLVPGVDEEVGGLVLLPAASIGVLIGMGAFLYFTGWWRAIGVREVGGRERRIPTSTMLAAGIAMAVIIGTTILNFTFVGVSILFMLLMMRAGTLGISPVVDLIRGKRIRSYAWAGLALSLLAVVVALAGVDAYTLTLGAVLSLLAYLAGYVVRFRIMSRDAKTGDVAIDRRYFAGEQATAAVGLFAICALFALIGAGPEMQALREGFTEFLFTPEALLAILVGLLYSTLYVFGTLIYLDPREYTWSVPVNRASSVLSAAVASYALLWLFGAAAPHYSTLIASGMVLAAIAALSYPQLRDLVTGTASAAPRRLILFVCGGNTGRSPIAAALTRSELEGWDPREADNVYATSAGVGVNLAGKPMAPEAVAALAELGIKPHPHGSQELTAKLCEQASVIYCMTEEQRRTVLEIAPFAAERTFRLDPEGDLAEPEHGSVSAWSAFAGRVQGLVRERLPICPRRNPRPALPRSVALRGRGGIRRSRIDRASEAAISATVTEPPSAPELAAASGSARYLEIRADLAGDFDPAILRERFGGRLVYSLRSADRGGAGPDAPAARRPRLLAAAEAFDFVDLELDRDLDPELLERIPPERRRISWHGAPAPAGELRARFERMAEVPARLYLLAPAARSIADGLAPLQLLADLGRDDVTAYATGAAGTWSRLLAPRLGARLTFGRLREGDSPGPLTVSRLRADYGLPMMGSLRDLYGMVGANVGSSLAPRIYNKGFRALGLPALCLPFTAEDFGVFWRELVQSGLPGLGIAPRGLTVVTPYKEEALAAATLATIGAREAGAANSLVRAGHAWQGATTTRLVGPLASAGLDAAGVRTAVVGCGGAGRSVAAELLNHGADVTLVNRGARRGRYASELLGLEWVPLADFEPGGYDLIVHATTLADRSPFDPARIAPGAAVVDLVYRRTEDTALIAAARGRGITALDGRCVLANETGSQFELMTGQPMPPDAVAVAAGEPA